MSTPVPVWSPDPPRFTRLPPEALSLYLRTCRLISARKWRTAYVMLDQLDAALSEMAPKT